MNTSILHRKVLVLNQTYEPLSIVPLRKVLKKIIAGSESFYVEKTNGTVQGQNKTYPIPSVIRLKAYVKFRKTNTRLTASKKSKIFQRDSYKCIYCGYAGSRDELTLDHVLPKSRGGDDTPFNLVTACYKCNNRKGDRTPEEAGLFLNKTVLKSNIDMHSLLSSMRSNPDWKEFLYS